MIRELVLVLLFLAVQTSHASIPWDNVTKIKKARLCQDLLTSGGGVPRAFGNFRLRGEIYRANFSVTTPATARPLNRLRRKPSNLPRS